jgi:beta-lactamase regulating signal transducer with metallopeptidase domain
MINLLVEAAMRSSLLGLALALALIFTRSRNPHVHKLISAATLIVSLVMPILIQVRVMPVIPAPDYVLTLQAQANSIRATQFSMAWNSINAFYLLIALALLWRYLRSLLRMWRVRRDAQPVEYAMLGAVDMGDVDVRVTARVSSPCTIGSTILLPAGFPEWSRQKLTAVLAHERAHVLNKDCYLLWLARLNTCMFWFNPLAWWLQRELAALSETTSDEAAVAAVADRPAYAEILLDFAARRATSDVAAAISRPPLTTRIERIISATTLSAAPRLWRRILIVVGILPMVAAAATPLGMSMLHLAQSRAPASNTTPGPEVTSQQPSVKQYPDLGELTKYYPQEAEQHGIEGLVHIQVTLDEQGRATDTLILSEDPLNMGFGAAASALAHVMEYNNPAGRPVQLDFNVKFALGQPTPANGTTNFETPSAP